MVDAGARQSARERLLAAAARRFYRDGVSATGIDAITTEAGVAKMSLYNNFSSKADLVRAYLEARHEEWRELHRRRLARAADARGRVLAVFDAYADHAELAHEHGFRGCGLLNAAAELPAGHDGRAVVRRHKEEVESLLSDALGEQLPDRPEDARAAAEHLAFLLEGAMARAGLEGDGERLRHARTMAADLVGRL
ncbi:MULTISPECIES: TetR/AcrR family transcriptional regulator [unclassified Saccharopolyspora]|uniref:TetR/AcrR family transcriptional regulator n=1 Tax=unclassified Saccharopolyspora TaxID=2646250 RepID=UPI001CD276D5|nr:MULTISPECIES: TetR/AcrR family transcriptional regulator [unclassified Saccharopolyspora]MCA1187093.1 TetR/AcrR family transcriptional regulator [Saccharopolyspora sp. 6T]MCA1279445.1 TetR/AcrR family transcriptional regulator [Saccharopolyspora sp. 7B]